MLDLESWASGSILTGGNIFLLFFLFSRSKASDANIGIIANVVCLWKPRISHSFCHTLVHFDAAMNDFMLL